jgi:hypothetical protein
MVRGNTYIAALFTAVAVVRGFTTEEYESGAVHAEIMGIKMVGGRESLASEDGTNLCLTTGTMGGRV